MFRESDYVDKKPHKSNQPVPIFQALSRASRLDDGQAEKASSRSNYPTASAIFNCDRYTNIYIYIYENIFTDLYLYEHSYI
jgi:hypothetical protein